MKKLSVHLIILCTFFLHLSNTQAADVEYFDFDKYDAHMASMDERDRDAEKQINRLLAPLDVPLGGNRGNLYNALGDDDAIMQEILAESVRTARIEQERREQQVQPAEWEPSSMNIIDAGELVMQLRRNNHNIIPTPEQMADYLVLNMRVTAAQAKKILEELF